MPAPIARLRFEHAASLFRATSRTLAALVFLFPALGGCVGGGGGPTSVVLDGRYLPETMTPTPDERLPALLETIGMVPPFGEDADPFAARGGSASTGATPGRADGDDGREISASHSSDASGTGAADDGQNPPGSESLAGTEAGSSRLAEPARNNPEAHDLLDNWGHRQTHRITAGLSLQGAGEDAAASDLGTLKTAASADGEAVALNLDDTDEVGLLGARHGITYGRWSGGPADTLSIEFDLSRSSSKVRNDVAVRAMIERAGKMWSSRIDDTWAVWERSAGETKGNLLNGEEDPTLALVGIGGETSTGVEIDIRDADLSSANIAGWAIASRHQPPGDAWEPRFGSIEIDIESLHEDDEASLFSTLVHEIGHVLGSWSTGSLPARFDSYINTVEGTWTGPNVVVEHGGAAPFQDAADPTGWVDGERDDQASRFDFDHSGVCDSVMAYCTDSSAQPAFLPIELDFAFLADLGMTIEDETDRPETYGLAGWTEYAGFTLSVSRKLRIALADPQPHYDGAANSGGFLDVTDLLGAEADVFGYRSSGVLGQSYPSEGPEGTVRYAGGLLGAALDMDGLPPVTGDACFAVDLGTLDGTASFTSLAVHARGISAPFSGGSLHYPFDLSGNSIVGSAPDSMLRADFYGPGHGDVAGTLRDPRAGLLASFGASADNRPDREDVIASANLVGGLSVGRGFADASENGWSLYRCETGSICQQQQDDGSGGWRGWATTTRSHVLASTAGTNLQVSERPDADHDFLRIARRSTASTDGRRGRHVVDGYTGTMANASFGTGFDLHTDWHADSGDTLSNTAYIWSGFQGSWTGGRPTGRATWSGRMFGYQGGHQPHENPWVEGTTTAHYSIFDQTLDVAFSDVASKDGERTLADFGFSDVPVSRYGTFLGGGTAGILGGAFFGSSHAEVAGSFHHNPAGVTGSFGAIRELGTTVAAQRRTEDAVPDATDDVVFHALDGWGPWGTEPGEDGIHALIRRGPGNRTGRICRAPRAGRPRQRPRAAIPFPGRRSGPVRRTPRTRGPKRMARRCMAAPGLKSISVKRPSTSISRVSAQITRTCRGRRCRWWMAPSGIPGVALPLTEHSTDRTTRAPPGASIAIISRASSKPAGTEHPRAHQCPVFWKSRDAIRGDRCGICCEGGGIRVRRVALHRHSAMLLFRLLTSRVTVCRRNEQRFPPNT